MGSINIGENSAIRSGYQIRLKPLHVVISQRGGSNNIYYVSLADN